MGVPKIGVPPNHPFYRDFHYKYHPFWDTYIYTKESIILQKQARIKLLSQNVTYTKTTSNNRQQATGNNKQQQQQQQQPTTTGNKQQATGNNNNNNNQKNMQKCSVSHDIPWDWYIYLLRHENQTSKYLNRPITHG